MNQTVAETSATDAQKRPGRPKIHADNCARFKAFREKRRAEGMHEVRLWVHAGEQDAVRAAQAVLDAAIAERDRLAHLAASVYNV